MLVLAEVLAAGAGCLVLARRRPARWMTWWVALVVALAPTDDVSSRLVGPLLGVTFPGFAVVPAVVLVVRCGSPW